MVSSYLTIDPELEEEFLIHLLFELTIAYRSVSSDEKEDCNHIQDGLKQINEINHRVLNRIRDIRQNGDWFTKESTWEMIEHHINLSPLISGWVKRAIKNAFNKINA